MLKKLIVKIKRKDNKFYSILYIVGKKVRNFNIPYIFIIHLPLFILFNSIKKTLIYLKRKFYDEPIFSRQCSKVGKNLRLPNGRPFITGDLCIEIGDNVTIYRSTFGASHILDTPTLVIGNNSTIGYGTTIAVAKSVLIKDDVLIAPNCYLTDNDEHPLDSNLRRQGLPVSADQVSPIEVGYNSWIGYNSIILKGVTIGNNSIISAHSFLSKSVPENSMVMGNPARAFNHSILMNHGAHNPSLPTNRSLRSCIPFSGSYQHRPQPEKKLLLYSAPRPLAAREHY